MIIGFVIVTICMLFFMGIGVWAWKAKEPVGFFTGVKPPRVKDVTAYNHAVAKIWIGFSIAFEIVIGVPLLFVKQNSAGFVIPILLCLPLVIGMAVAYIRVEAKYKA